MGFNCEEVEDFSMEEVDAMQKYEQLNFKVSNPLNEQCFVKYMTEDTTTKKTSSNLIKKINISGIVSEVFLDEESIKKTDTLVIITNEYSQESIHKSLKNIWEMEGYYVVIFDLKQLQLNILKHNYVPKHVKLSDKEKVELYEKINIQSDSQLPEISRFDPVAKIIFLRPDNVCKITRFDKISYTNEYFRICV
jgi:DNA-directed RNA polymerase subunit H (RpoH/RPB5)